MAVYTTIEAEQLDAFLADYDIGGAIAFKGIAEGVENSNYYLETDKGRFILTLFEKRVNPDDLPYFVGLKQHLSAKGFPCPEPVAAKNGMALRELAGRPALIVTFLKGMSPNRPNAAQCRGMGEGLARMHNALADFEMQRINDLGPASWPKLFAGREAVAESLAPGLEEVISESLAKVEALRSVSDHVPRGTIHADLFPDNAFFLGDEFAGVIDFYFACTDALAYDIAVCLNAWAFEPGGHFNYTRGQALIAGYESVRPLEPAEREAMPTLALGAALRFFLTRLVDWTDTPEGALVKPKNPLDYADRIRFHRAAKGIGDYGG